MTRELKDISAMEDPDLAAVQRKISAGGDMRIAIKRFLDEFSDVPGLYPIASEYRTHYRKRIKELRKAMEGWSNA